MSIAVASDGTTLLNNQSTLTMVIAIVASVTPKDVARRVVAQTCGASVTTIAGKVRVAEAVARKRITSSVAITFRERVAGAQRLDCARGPSGIRSVAIRADIAELSGGVASTDTRNNGEVARTSAIAGCSRSNVRGHREGCLLVVRTAHTLSTQ